MTTPKNTTGLKLDPKRKAVLVDALLNQNYKQVQGQLMVEAGDEATEGDGSIVDFDRFCCLGVATNVCALKGVVEWGKREVYGSQGDLPDPVLSWYLGHPASPEEVATWDSISETLIKFNDGGTTYNTSTGRYDRIGAKTFKFIANWIDKNL